MTSIWEHGRNLSTPRDADLYTLNKCATPRATHPHIVLGQAKHICTYVEL